MSEMLTAKEMQELLQVDRSTIYRMAEAGQLPALRVGKQWRFPSDQVEGWFGLKLKPIPIDRRPEEAPLTRTESDTLADLLPMECVQLLLDTFADMLGVMLVLTDLEGNPVTRISNPCGLFQSISSTPHAVQRCIQSWHDLGSDLGFEPKFKKSHLGLLCAGSMIRVGTELKGMVVAGCLAPDSWPPNDEELDRMASNIGVSVELLRPHLDEVFRLDKSGREWVLDNLRRVAHIVAHIVNERRTLVSRLQAIADLTAF